MALALGNIQKPLTEGLTALVGGAAQRAAWHKSSLVGIIATVALTAIGALGEMNTRQGTLLNDVSVGAMNSGATALGWVGYERAIIVGGLLKSQTGALAQGKVAGLLPAASEDYVRARATQEEFNTVREW